MMRKHALLAVVISLFVGQSVFCVPPGEFLSPPDTARPWVYFFVMDGNLSREGITADLEAMQDQGIGGLILMEVNVGVPRGPVDFMSDEWQQLFAHLVRESERLGLQLALSSGPGWAGSGGPWITPEHSMWHLVASEKTVKGPLEFNELLPLPQPRRPYFGEGLLPEKLEKARKEFFKDVRVLAFQKPREDVRVEDINEKALYVREPYSSVTGVKPRLAAPTVFAPAAFENAVDPNRIVDLTDRLDASGRLQWDVPDGEWVILRFAATSTGANTRPAPAPGVGLESSKMDRAAFDIHADHYISKLFQTVGRRQTDGKAGWCYFHLDSWEMGPQNYSDAFLSEFFERRGYDPVPFLPAYLGMIVDSPEKTERFLWDVRQTAQEMVIENYGRYLKEFAHRNDLKLSIEPYDMMPCCNMTFGAIADLPMCEFWCSPYDTVFSCFEAASTAHTNGRPVVSAEAFTSGLDRWQQNPKTMKQRGDWAFCSGVNRFTFHRYQHQPYLDRYPGFSMGSIGIHWERTQTWWPLIGGYHEYLARCQHVLQQGTAVVDVLYLLLEGAPQVFTPPESALIVSGLIKDQRGYRFDACEPVTFLERAFVENGNVAFPNGTSYKLLVLPDVPAMTLPMLEKIESLVREGATVVGNAPKQSPGLQGYPKVDGDIQNLAAKMWGNAASSQAVEKTVRVYGKGQIIALPTTPTWDEPLVFAGAKWVWFPEGNPAWDAPSGSRFFRRTFQLRDDETVLVARMIGVADNEMRVKINGREVYAATLSGAVTAGRFADFLKTGDNVVEIEAVNHESDQRNPAGLIAKFEIVTRSPDSERPVRHGFVTDDQWQASQDGRNWKDAMLLGDFGMGPWNVANSAAGRNDSLYPEYEVTAKILADQNIPVDSDAPEKGLRYFHRRDGAFDYYFVGNRSEEPFRGDVSFRIAGKHASIWDPVTGRIFRSPPTRTENGQTFVPLDLEGSQSVFVVFGEEKPDSVIPVWQKRPQKTVLDLSQNWNVRFDPRRGGPEKPVAFRQLRDWSTDDDEKIKFYSGIATYEKSFAVSEETLSRGKRLRLDLGNVEVIAKIRLNGKDIGTRWMAPYEWDVTEHLQSGENTLEIEVANLWINRLIGDSALPPERRTTWTTFNGAYNARSPLAASGLIGPVRLLEE